MAQGEATFDGKVDIQIVKEAITRIGVEDKGGAIKGPDRIDLFFDSHKDAIQWGRRKVNVDIERR